MNTANRMKKLLVLALAMVMCVTSMVIPATAAGQEVNVRVNGYLVNFPDQKPIINSDGRTLIPVRFVAEELGAEVTWNNRTHTAFIKKDGVTIEIPIGKTTLKVTNANGKTENVEMDTKAVLENGRTLVPIRFVAEAMGSYVSYSASFQTVEIYNDVLTPDEIEEIRALPFRGDYCAEKLQYKNSSTPFEDMHEYAFKPTKYAVSANIRTRFNDMTWDSEKDSTEKLANLYVANAQSEMGAKFSDNAYGVTATFRTDASAITSLPASKGTGPYTIYGYLTITFDKDANVAAYKKFHRNCDFGNVKAGNSYTYLVETLWLTNAGFPYPHYNGIWNRTNGTLKAWQ